MDREVDLVSPLLTPLTYEGLIDDTVGIENGRVRLDASVLGNENSQDPLAPKLSSSSAAASSAVGAVVDAAAAAGTICNAAYFVFPLSVFLFAIFVFFVLFVAALATGSSAAARGEKVPVMLSNNDAIFAEIRNLSIERLGAFLQDKAIHIRER
jgi:hypothetical protein